jgi:hypothetical protein
MIPIVHEESTLLVVVEASAELLAMTDANE